MAKHSINANAPASPVRCWFAARARARSARCSGTRLTPSRAPSAASARSISSPKARRAQVPWTCPRNWWKCFVLGRRAPVANLSSSYPTHRATTPVERITGRNATSWNWAIGWKTGAFLPAKNCTNCAKNVEPSLPTAWVIFAGSRALRHADIRITSQYYADKKVRITTGLDTLLA